MVEDHKGGGSIKLNDFHTPKNVVVRFMSLRTSMNPVQNFNHCREEWNENHLSYQVRACHFSFPPESTRGKKDDARRESRDNNND
jgi:hypothetical protein